MTNIETYRPKSAIALAAVAFLLIALYLVQVILYGQLVSGITFATTAATTTWLLFVKPKVVFSDEAIMIVNPFVTTTVPWSDVEQIETRFALTVVANDRRIQAWAAPAPGRGHGKNIRSTELQGLNLDASLGLRPGDSPRSHSGVAAQIAKARLAAFDASSASRVIASTRISVSAAAILSVCVVVLVISNVLHY